MSRQVQGDTARGFISVLDVAQKAHKHVHEHDGSHAAVEDPAVTTEVDRILHVVLQSDDLWKRIGTDLISICSVDTRTVCSSSDRGQITISSWSDRGQITMSSWSDRGQITISSWSDHGPLTLRSRSVPGQIVVRSRSVRGQITVRSLLDHNQFLVRSRSDHDQFLVRSRSAHS